MSQIPVGEAVSSPVVLVDEFDDPILGATITEIANEGPDGNPFVYTWSEGGGGVYWIRYTPTLVGGYNLVIKTNTTLPQWWSVEDVAYGSTTGTQPTVMAAGGTTLQDLIRQTAVMLGDLLQTQATEDGAGDGSTWHDTLNASAISPTSYKGAELFVTSAVGGNLHQLARILDSTVGDPPTFTLTPPLPEQVMTGDQADITNLESGGFHRQQYIMAINTVIAGAFPNFLVPLAYDVPDSFDWGSPYLTIPDTFTHLFGVQYQSPGDGVTWIPIQRSGFNAPGEGWWWDANNRKLAIGGYSAQLANATALRLMGYGKQPPLLLASDATLMDSEWIRNEAAAMLGRGKGDPQRLALAQIDKGDADLLRAKMGIDLMPDTVRL